MVSSWARRAPHSTGTHSTRTGHLLGLALLALILEGVATALGETFQEELVAPAGVAGGAGSQLCSLLGAGVALILTGKVPVGYGPKALPRAQGKLKDNIELFCSFSDRHCGWKIFLTAPVYGWES